MLINKLYSGTVVNELLFNSDFLGTVYNIWNFNLVHSSKVKGTRKNI